MGRSSENVFEATYCEARCGLIDLGSCHLAASGLLLLGQNDFV